MTDIFFKQPDENDSISTRAFRVTSCTHRLNKRISNMLGYSLMINCNDNYLNNMMQDDTGCNEYDTD